MTVRLSKSKIIAGRQCPKRLWLQVHDRDAADRTTNAAALAMGHEVGAAAQRQYPQGELVGSHEDIAGSLARTRERLAGNGPCVLFEATFQADDVLVLADIVERRVERRHGRLALIEVKGSTSVKDYHRDDAAVQAHVMTRAGHEPDYIALRHIDNRFIYRGDGDYHGLFRDEDLTAEAKARGSEVAGWIRTQQALLAGGEPGIDTGPQCHAPYDCEFLAHCNRQAGGTPVEYPLTVLPNAGRLVNELAAEGYRDIREVPATRLRGHTVHLRIREASRSGRAFLDPAARALLANAGWPRYHLDFEGVNPAVPLWAGTRPYQALPFQFSLHVERRDGSLEHYGYLHTERAQAPMRPTMEALLAVIGKRGPVFVYNKAYEGSVLRAMAQMFPDLAETLLAIPKRFIDLLDIARQHYYHPAMKGSWSIKNVLPTIDASLDYSEGLGEVRDGGGAQAAFIELMRAETAAERRAGLTDDLERYCERDTLAMVKLAEAFAGGG